MGTIKGRGAPFTSSDPILEVRGRGLTDDVAGIDFHARAGVDFDQRLIAYNNQSHLFLSNSRGGGFWLDNNGSLVAQRMRALEAFDTTDVGVTSTGYVASGPTRRFLGPDSGRVSIHYRCMVRPDTQGNFAFATVRVFRVSDQVTIFGPSDQHALIHGPTQFGEMHAGMEILVDVTPGVEYDCRFEYRSFNGGACTYRHRYISVTPSP